MAIHRLRILHLSDLHERMILPSMTKERAAKIQLQAASRVRVLQGDFLRVLNAIGHDRPIDFLCFTGDVADWGLPEEYVAAEE